MTPILLPGERVTLREFTLDDWRAVHDYASRPELCRYLAWGPNTEAETQAHVAGAILAAPAQPRTIYRLAAVLTESGRLIGDGGLEIESLLHRRGEISYVVHPDLWGQGCATQIARLLLRFGVEQLGLHRIYATCDPRNTASARVLETAGLLYEGRQRDTLLLRDGWRDSAMYGLLEHEWRATDGVGRTVSR